jgi:hypothetical protein
MSLFQLAALFLALIGLAGWVNARLLHWPSATVMILAGGLNAGLLLGLQHLSPRGVAGQVIAAVAAVDFPRAVLHAGGPRRTAPASIVDLEPRHPRRDCVHRDRRLGPVVDRIASGIAAQPPVGLRLRRADQPDGSHRGSGRGARGQALEGSDGGPAGRGPVQRRGRHRDLHRRSGDRGRRRSILWRPSGRWRSRRSAALR